MFSRRRGYQIPPPLGILFYVYVKFNTVNSPRVTCPPLPPRLPGAKSDSKKAVITPCHKPTFVGSPYMGRGISLFEFLEKLLLSHSGVKKGCANAQPRGIITHDSV